MAGADLCADRGAERGGHFTWSEWAEEFGPRVQTSGRSITGRSGRRRWWRCWRRKGIAAASEVLALTERWQAAARATPHGKPILLSAAD
jgi:hypothetical protein